MNTRSGGILNSKTDPRHMFVPGHPYDVEKDNNQKSSCHAGIDRGHCCIVWLVLCVAVITTQFQIRIYLLRLFSPFPVAELRCIVPLLLALVEATENS